MTVLGIDTATASASVAIIQADQLIAKRVYPDEGSTCSTANSVRRKHSEILIPLIRSALDEAGVELRNLTGVAVSIGPGSFTGVRIGLSTAKGIAFGCDVPMVGISTLHAYAAASDFSDLVCPLVDARKDEVYLALFERRNGELTRLTDDLALASTAAIDYIAERIDDRRCALIGDGAVIYGERFKRVLGERVEISARSKDCVAAAVARLGRARIGAGAIDEAAQLTPAYVRVSYAQARRQVADNLSV